MLGQADDQVICCLCSSSAQKHSNRVRRLSTRLLLSVVRCVEETQNEPSVTSFFFKLSDFYFLWRKGCIARWWNCFSQHMPSVLSSPGLSLYITQSWVDSFIILGLNLCSRVQLHRLQLQLQGGGVLGL